MVTLLAAGVGGEAALHLKIFTPIYEGPPAEVHAPPSSTTAVHTGEEHGEKGAAGEATGVMELPAIVTNLSDSPDSWVRLQAAALIDSHIPPTQPPLTPQELAADLLALVRTFPLERFRGPSGFLHLHEDLKERASLRSNGRIRDIVVYTLVIQ